MKYGEGGRKSVKRLSVESKAASKSIGTALGSRAVSDCRDMSLVKFESRANQQVNLVG